MSRDAPDLDRLLARIAGLCELPGPSGREELVRRELEARWSSSLDIAVDRRGNLIGSVGTDGPKLALVVHMDEVGWTVRSITEDGFLLIDQAQGSRRDRPDVRHMIGQDVVVLGREGVAASGIFAAPSGHVLSREQLDEWPRPGEHFVDVGLATREEVETLGIHIGSPVTFAAATRRVGSRIAGKAMDNRVLLCAVDLLLERIRRSTLTCTLVVAATVHEEGGLHGAYALNDVQDFDLAIALDIGLVGDIPFVSSADYETRLGGGPILVHKDGRIAYDHTLTWAIADVAAERRVPVQHGVMPGASTDGIPLLRAGVPTAYIGMPTRYTHTAFEMVEPDDLLDLVDLLEALVSSDALKAISSPTA
jgi:endoglucanase